MATLEFRACLKSDAEILPVRDPWNGDVVDGWCERWCRSFDETHVFCFLGIEKNIPIHAILMTCIQEFLQALH